jgi:sigma-B regulation protein RsbU (phosphoserine phosphatase)
MAENIEHTRTEKLLLQAGRVFNSTLEYEELMGLVLNLVVTAVDAEAALVYRIDQGQPDMKIRYLRHPEFTTGSIRRKVGAGVVGWVAESREPLILNDTEQDPRLDRTLEQDIGIKFRSIISLPLIGKGHMIGVVEAINKRQGGFGPEDMDILTGLNHQIAVAIDNAHLYREMKREALEKSLLYESGKILSGSLSLDEVLKAILDSLRQAVYYSSGGVFLVDDRGKDVKSIYSVGYDSANSAYWMKLKFGQGLVGTVASSGEAVIVPDVAKDLRYVNANPGTRSEIVVPIKASDRVIGVINLESERINAFDDHSLSLISAFASQAAISLERARMHESIVSARKLDEQLNVARAIQQSFLPKHDPEIPGYEITGRNISSGQVGGDYYDFIHIVERHVGVAIADVSGKGIPAALIMASFRASLIAEIRNNYSIRTIGEKVNSLMCESLEPGNYVTGVYGVLDSRNHIFTFSNFGHNPPILLRQNGQVEYLKEGGPVLGVSPGAAFEERALLVSPGEVLVLYTDGVTEVFDDLGKDFGPTGLVRVLKENNRRPAREIADAIYAAVKEFAGSAHTYDDITMIVVKRVS